MTDDLEKVISASSSQLSDSSTIFQQPTTAVRSSNHDLRTSFSPLRRSPQRLQLELERTHSFSLTSGPSMVKPSARLPIDFRTLSIQVTDTKRGTTEYKGKKNIADLSVIEWHLKTVQELCTSLGVNSDQGLDKLIASRRLIKNGKNIISKPKSNLAKKIFFYIFGGFGSILILASTICFLSWKPLGNPSPQASNLALAIVLLVVVVIQACFNAYQDWSTSRVMTSISDMLPSFSLVVRDGDILEIPSYELVSGDIVKIKTGTKVPCDLRLIEVSSDVRFDRSILTGESIPIAGTVESTDINFMESRNIALAGTTCVEGEALAICVGLGDNTVFGRIAQQATIQSKPTTLQIEVTRFVTIIAALATFTATFIAILWAAWLRTAYPNFLNVSGLLIDCVSVFVAFIPEGLPICLTVSLSVIAASMKKKNILCKSLSTVESLGCVSVICSDKTGTLTQNKMSVVNLTIGTECYSTNQARDLVSSQSSRPLGDSIKVLASICSLCNDATFEKSSIESTIYKRKINGDATDTGILRFAENIVPSNELRNNWTEVGKIGFNSKNKFALKLFKNCNNLKGDSEPISSIDNFTEQDLVLLVKGAPDILLRRSTQYLTTEGTYQDLDNSAIESITRNQMALASEGKRVILLAKKIIKSGSINKEMFSDSNLFQETLLEMNDSLIVVGMVALVDPPRDDTTETVLTCRKAGIRFMMVTGDFALTGTAIARQCGIITNRPENIKHFSDLPRDKPMEEISEFDRYQTEDTLPSSLVLSGSEIISMTESQWKQTLAFDEVVFARTSPQQKLQIVKAYQSAGDTVCVTGDGVNDAAALKQADVGVCVANGSQVALEAADLILLDGFSALVEGIRSGRLCFENLKKVILYLLPAGSFSELMPVLVNVLFGLPQVLSNIQMILICTVTDVLPALSLVFEKPEADLLLRKPRNRKLDRLADYRLLIHAYLLIGVIESLTSMFGAFYFGFVRAGIPFSSLWLQYGNYNIDADLLAAATTNAQSIYFFNLVLMQWFNLLSTRTRRLSIFQQNPLGNQSTRNYYIFPAALIALILAVFFSYIPLFQNIFGTSGIAVEYYFLPMSYGIALLFLDESRKYWIRGHARSFLAKIAW